MSEIESQWFIIPGRLMGRNEYDYASRSHWSKANEAKKAEQERVIWAMRQAGIQPMPGAVEIGCNFIEGRQKNGRLRDPDNIAGGAWKVIFDAMKEAGIIEDDNPRIVRNLFPRFAYNASNPHVEVQIMKFNPDGRTVYFPPPSGL